MIYNKAFENVFTLENGLVSHVDFDLLEQKTNSEYVEWLGNYLEDDMYLVRGVFATHEFLVLILSNSVNDDFRICRFVLTGSYRGQMDVDMICLPEIEMINAITQVIK